MGWDTTARGVAYPDANEPVTPLEGLFQTVAESVDDALDDVYGEITSTADELLDPARCHAWRNSAVSLADSTWTAGISLQETAYDLAPSAQHSGDLSRIYFRVTGLYRVTWQVTLVGITSGALRGMVRENAADSSGGGTVCQELSAFACGAGTNCTVTGSFERAFAEGDYVQLFAWQGSGSTVNTVSGAYATFMQTCLVAA